jgi:hypothetical protein
MCFLQNPGFEVTIDLFLFVIVLDKEVSLNIERKVDMNFDREVVLNSDREVNLNVDSEVDRNFDSADDTASNPYPPLLHAKPRKINLQRNAF